MRWLINASLAGALAGLAPVAVSAQTAAPPLYRVFLADGTALASFGEWARVDDRLIFSMPLAADAGPSDLHLVSLPVQRVDLARTERYADTVRAAHYAASRGEADFAELSARVAAALNQVALLPTPAERLAAAERARRSLADWPAAHFRYRAGEVAEIIGILDEVIASLRASAGLGRFELSLSTTTDAPAEPALQAPDQADLARQLMAASSVVDSPVEKVSLLRAVVALIDRAMGVLPTAFATTLRATALGGIAEEQRIDGLYARLRSSVLTEAARHARQADLRSLERLRSRVVEQDRKLGGRRRDEVAGIVATIDAHVEASQRLRLAQDRWLLHLEGMRAYQRATRPYRQTLTELETSLGDIRAMMGPSPQVLQRLTRRLLGEARLLALIEAPAQLAAVHAVFRSAYELAQNAVQLRLDAAQHADVDLARQAAAAASGALMLLTRARTDLETAMQPPIAQK